MAPLKDPDLVTKFQEALKEWNCDGYIVWKRRAAELGRPRFLFQGL